MYLSRDQNSELLQEMAELSSPGSMFLMSVVSAHSIGVQRDPKSLLYTWKWGFPETFFWVSAGFPMPNCSQMSSTGMSCTWKYYSTHLC